MKTLITIFFLLFLASCVPLPAQNILSLTYERSDNGVGLRYDRQFKHSGLYGVYIGAGYGCYLRPTINAYEHYKFQMGWVRYLRNYAEPDWQIAFSAGVNGHYYHEIQRGYPSVEKRATFPVSGELGVMFIIWKHFSVGWTWDVAKSDCVFAVGGRFGL